ncbi:uncharacterized protein LOC133814221 [Humulus lupulus]|uniref:uncharacterized protein LOC133814221 n=1 Tax=Humulus lupulus TaxID=3486 RepID=UPI002B40C4E1|nr:uncharacterized protein LOC133814221 [Humulus lupulus]
MGDLDGIGEHIRTYLTNEVGLENFTRLYSANNRYSTMTSNIAESINRAIKEVRELLVATSNMFVFTVHDEETEYIVNMENKTCNCQRFQCDDMPCSYAMAVIIHKNLNCYKYVSYYYKTDAYIATYEDSILPLGDHRSWELPQEILEHYILPPVLKCCPSRPKKTRYKGFNEPTVYRTCNRCELKGHTRRTCRNKPLLKPTKGRK